ncbi:MAG: MFS transporter [Clostridium sp.]|nr:MFS transporter [Clostridium sp.]
MEKSIKREETYFSNVLLYGFYYLALAVCSVLISIYLMEKGLSATQVSLTVSASCIMSMVIQPIVGVLQDSGNKKIISVIILAVSAATGLLFMIQNTFAGLLLLYSLTVAFSGSVGAYIEKIATTSRFSYRSIRIWGTIGYGVGSQICGIVYEKISPESVYIFFAACILLAAAGILGSNRPEEKQTVPEKEKESEASRGGVFISATSTILFIGTLMELPIIILASLYMNRFSNCRLLQIVPHPYKGGKRPEILAIVK